MNYPHYLFKKTTLLLAVAGTSLLIGSPAITRASIAQQSGTEQTPVNPSNSVTTPPLPGRQQAPSARIVPVNGKVNIKLTNLTAAPMTYQVIGDTKPRTLPGKTEVILMALEAPTTLTFLRQDGGLLQVEPQVSAEPGVLQVTFTEATDLGIDKNALVIEETGEVFFN